MTHSQGCKAVLAALEPSPKTTPELVTATGINGAKLGNCIKALLQQGKISRTQVSRFRFQYYFGDSAPGWTPIEQQPPKRPLQYRQPVKVVNVSRSYFGDSHPINITLPAAPWETYSPTTGACDPAQPGNPTGEDADVTTHTVVAVPLTGPGAFPLPANGGM